MKLRSEQALPSQGQSRLGLEARRLMEVQEVLEKLPGSYALGVEAKDRQIRCQEGARNAP